ncbi:MAG: YaiI/YqxD family protein [Gammaproteobacteria bacterium]|nr:YaiI/YqxD family protein [Gammaproteobacteria bacterium]
MTSRIWVDADACPVVIREILVRAATRTQTPMTLLANHAIRVPNSPYIKCIQVASGFDVADNEIVRRCEKGDLVITSDIPLADEVITKGAEALSSRGEPYTKDNIKQRLNMRDFMDTMRSSGVHSGGPPPLGNQEKQRFANALDRWLAKRIR